MKFANWYFCEIYHNGDYRLRAYKYEFIGKIFYNFSNAQCKIFVNGNTEIIRNMLKNTIQNNERNI